MRLPKIVEKNIGNFRQCGGSPSDLAALLYYMFRSTTMMYLPPELKRRTYGWRERFNPLTLSIETTSRCNASCVMCPRTTRGIKADEPIRDELLDHEIVKTLMKQTPHSVFNPSGFGEPLVDPHVPEYIRVAHNDRKLTRLTTNASLLSNEKAHALMSAGLDMFILSIDGADKETYEKVRRGLQWKDTKSNVQSLKAIRAQGKYRTYIQINIVINQINKDKIQNIINYWHPHVDNIRTLKEARHWKHIKRVQDPIPIRKCFAPWETMIVFSNGDIPLCCRDVEGEYILGNILEDDPVSIWNSDFARSVRKAFVEKKDYPEICHYCEIPIVDEYYKDKNGNMRSMNTATRQVE